LLSILFEILAPFFGGIISQLYQEGKICLKTLFFFIWISFFASALGMVFFTSTPFGLHDFLLAIIGGFVVATVCVVVIIALRKWGFVKKQQ